MRKLKAVFIFLMLVIAVSGSYAQEISEDALVNAVSGDFDKFLTGIGKDISPVLIQNAVSGQNIGQAEIGEDRFYFNIIPVAAVSSGSGFMPHKDVTGYYEVVNLDNLIVTNIGSLIRDTSITDSLFGTTAYYPSFRLNAGVKVFSDIELLINGFYLPSSLVGLASGLLSELEQITLSALNISAFVRYPILKDTGVLPAVSVGVGYVFDNFTFELADLTSFSTYFSGFDSLGFGLETVVQAFTIQAGISKQIGFFIPFARMSAWYADSSYTPSATVSSPLVIDPVESNDIYFIAEAGSDLKFGKYIINLAGNYNLSNGVWGASIGSRFQF